MAQSKADTASQASLQSDNVSVPHEEGIHVVRSITVDRPVEELYRFWHTPTYMPTVFKNVESVDVIGDNRLRWVIKLPTDQKVELQVEVYTDVLNEVISWRSLPASEMQMAASVRFRPAPPNRGTEVQLTLEFVPPGGALSKAFLRLFEEAPQQYVGQFLREFKQVMETGEKATIEGQTSGRESEVAQ